MTAKRQPASRRAEPAKVPAVAALAKKNRLTVRLSDEELADITQGAELASQDRREIVESATLLREHGMRGIRDYIATRTAAVA